MEYRIRILNARDYDNIRWRAMCTIVNIRFFQERSLTFKAIYSKSGKLKGFEIRRAGSSSVLGYIDARGYLLYFINKRKVDSKAINLRSERYKEKDSEAIRYLGCGFFEWRWNR